MSLLSFQRLLSWIDDFESIGHYWTSETSIICITWFPGMGWNPNLERSEQLRQEQAVGWDQLRWTKCRGLGIGPFWNTCKSEGRIYKHWCVNPILLYCFSLCLNAKRAWCFFGPCLFACLSVNWRRGAWGHRVPSRSALRCNITSPSLS